MMISRVISAVDSHAGGEPVRIVVDGLPNILGETVVEKRDYLANNMDYVRTMLTWEPRGWHGMYAAIRVQPSTDEADAGVIFMSPSGYADMCGHGIIGVATVLIEMGVLPKKKPVTELVLETPAGLIPVRAKVIDGSVESVTFRNIPSFLYKGDVSIQVPSLGDVKVDVAFGGNFYAIVSSEQIGVEVRAENLDKLVTRGIAIKNATQDQVEVHHPDPRISPEIIAAEITDLPSSPEADGRNVVVYGVRSADRSPCGTGTCARMAALYAKEKLKLNEEFVHESIIGSLFRGKLTEEVKVGNYRSVVPEVTGSAYITGLQQFVIDSRDPFKHGFLL